jgi:putative oxidoreductase
MRKLFSTKYNAGAFNVGLLVLRLGAGILLAKHGYTKLIGFNEMQSKFMSFMGLSPSVTLGLVIFAEFFCAIFIALGLFTRLASIVLIILTVVIIFQVGNADVFGKDELATLYLAAFATLLFTGAGKISVDNMISR